MDLDAQLEKPKKKSQKITAVLAFFGGSFAFLYIGGWRVWLVTFGVVFGFRFFFYLPFEILGDGPFSFPIMKHVVILLMESLVFLWTAITYCSLLNRTIDAQEEIHELRSFKAGWASAVMVVRGLFPANLGAIVFCDIAASETLGLWSLPLAPIVTGIVVFLVNFLTRRILID